MENKSQIKKMLDTIFPTDIKCIFCGEEIQNKNQYNVCEKCKNSLPYNTHKICKHCGAKIEDLSEICNTCFNKLPPYKVAKAPFEYEYPISMLVYKFKFNNAIYLFEPLAKYIVDCYKKYNYDCDLVIPIPLSPKRLKSRHYNQAEEFAKIVAKDLNLELNTDSIIKVKENNRQAKLSFQKRKLNVEDAYYLRDATAIKSKNILVIDDVMTTGETMRSFCGELQKGKPKNIYVLTLARTDMKRKQEATLKQKIKSSFMNMIIPRYLAFKNRKKIKAYFHKYKLFMKQKDNKPE